MILKEIFEMQAKLDKAISEAHGVQQESVQQRRVIALIVEIGEFANEISSFKYWKKNIKHDREKINEEFADVIHFISSIALESGIDHDFDFKKTIFNDDLNAQFMKLYKDIIPLASDQSIPAVRRAIETLLGTAELAGITEEDILKHYKLKNQINYDRIANNY